MNHLSDEQIELLRERLLGELATLVERAGDFVQASADYAPEPGDPQDVASSEEARTNAANLAERDRQRIFQIEAALKRMEDGTYGVCEVSDEPIPFGRLEIEPTARTTVEAQEELEDELRALGGERREAY